MNWLAWIADNWYVVTIILLFLFGIYFTITNTEKVKEWLKYAVTIAEKELGGGVGQIKLRQVYDMFIERYPVFSQLVPFSVFSSWVDYALEFLRQQLEQNEKIKELVENTTEK